MDGGIIMSDKELLEIDQTVVRNLKYDIVIREKINLNDKRYNDSQMVKWIKDRIEEEVNHVTKINKA
jgi:hypothetical protein